MRNSARPLGLAFNVGMRLPAHLAATGKAMLAYHDAGLRARAAAARPAAAAGRQRPRRAVDELMAELAQTRAARLQHRRREACARASTAIGAPVFDAAGQPVAGIGVCINKAMLDRRPAASASAQVVDGRRLSQRLAQRLGARAERQHDRARGGDYHPRDRRA